MNKYALLGKDGSYLPGTVLCERDFTEAKKAQVRAGDAGYGGLDVGPDDRWTTVGVPEPACVVCGYHIPRYDGETKLTINSLGEAFYPGCVSVGDLNSGLVSDLPKDQRLHGAEFLYRAARQLERDEFFLYWRHLTICELVPESSIYRFQADLREGPVFRLYLSVEFYVIDENVEGQDLVRDFCQRYALDMEVMDAGEHLDHWWDGEGCKNEHFGPNHGKPYTHWDCFVDVWDKDDAAIATMAADMRQYLKEHGGDEGTEGVGALVNHVL